jgi:hypothetical protein
MYRAAWPTLAAGVAQWIDERRADTGAFALNRDFTPAAVILGRPQAEPWIQACLIPYTAQAWILCFACGEHRMTDRGRRPHPHLHPHGKHAAGWR